MKLANGLFYVLLLGLFSCNGNQETNLKKQSYSNIITTEKDVVVQTTSGKVAGYIENGTYIYKGIPYAEAERFMPPHAPKAWEGVRSSRAYGPTSPQGERMGWYSDEQAFAFNWDDGYQNENCQRVNVWTPSIQDKKKRPVMVWLHGGGYSAGSSQELPSYDGVNLSAQGDVVVVSVNHRLNVLGFLDLSAYGEKYAHSGNVGLLDLVAALQWVQDNIASFGGDPANVTIFGQSGGGGKVSTLMSTPLAKGLFHKAIVQSGSLLNTMEAKYSRMIGTQLLKNLNLKATDIDQLQQLPYTQLLEAGNKAAAQVKEQAVKDGFVPFIFGWAPTVDGDILPFQPADQQSIALSQDVPLLVGSTLNEFTASMYMPAYRNIDQAGAVEELKKRFGDRTDDFVAAFDQAYPTHKPQDLLDIDLIFRPAADRHAILKSNQQKAPVYTYLFTWQSPVLDGSLRATHCMELAFTFNNIQRCNTMTGGSKQAQELANIMSEAWIQFAYTGNPNTKNLPEWDAFNADNRAVMLFDDTCEMKYNHDKQLLEIANAFPFQGF